MAPCNRPFFVPLALLAAMAALAHQAVAQPRLEVPVDCRLPGQCMVQPLSREDVAITHRRHARHIRMRTFNRLRKG